jgi:hypothetical protein
VDQSVAEFVQKAMSDKLFRVYLGTDIIGCEIAGTSMAKLRASSLVFLSFLLYTDRIRSSAHAAP